jgi:tRNA(fMet)-specific endonuclease VapC
MTYFLLDTDICSYAIRGREDLQRRIHAHHGDRVSISVITEAELRFGALNRPSSKSLVDRFVLTSGTLPFTSSDTVAYAGLRLALQQAGTPIGANDMLIAAHALSRNMTLVTNNEREFRRVPGLRVENWAA